MPTGPKNNNPRLRPEGHARRRVRTLAAALLLGTAVVLAARMAAAAESPGVAAESTAAEFGLNELTRLLHRVTSATAVFHELQYRRVLKVPIERHGELRFEPPGVFEKRVLVPVTETYRLEGETLSIVMADRRPRQLSMRNQPLLGGLLLGFKAVVSGQLDMLSPHFETVVSGTPDAWRLDLRPVEPEVAEYIESITITGRCSALLRFEVLERNGDRTVTDIEPR